MISQRNILVVEDEVLMRSLVAMQLEAAGFNVIQAANAAEARAAADDNEIDVAVVDIELGNGPTGFDLATILRSNDPGIALVFLTHLPSPKLVGHGGSRVPKNAAYLIKNQITDATVLMAAIEAAIRDRVTDGFRYDKKVDDKFSNVSRSQIHVLRMMADGLSNQEIAEQRATTVRAVESLVGRAMQSAGVDKETGQARVLAVREFLKATGQLR